MKFIASLNYVSNLSRKEGQIRGLNEELQQETMMADTMVANMVSTDKLISR